MIVAGADNCPPKLKKSMYDFWQSRMLVYIKGKEHGRMVHDSFLNDPLDWGTIKANGVTRTKTYEELSKKEKLQADCDDPIACLNKAMIVMSTVMASRFPSTNNQLRTSSNPRNQATIQDGRVTIQQGKGHMARQCNQPKRPRNSAWFKEKDVARPGTRIWLDCDDISSTKAILMANLSSYDSDVLFEKAQRIKPTLYDGIMISKKHDVVSVDDYEETLILAEESRLKMLEKQNDLISKEKKVVKDRIIPTTITEGGWGFEHTKKVFLTEVIPFINSLRESFKDFDNGLHSEINEVKTVFNQMEAVVEQCSVDKKYFDIQKKELFLHNDRLLEHIICQDVMNIVMHADVVSATVFPVNNKYHVHDNLEIKGLERGNDHLFELLLSQDIVHICVNSLATRTNFHEMEQSFIDEYNETLKLKAQLAKEEHMEVPVYVTSTCPSLTKPNGKLVAVTLLNKNKKVRFAEPATSSSNTQKWVDPHNTQDSNPPLLTSTGLKSSTSSSRSQPSSITKKNRISRTTSRNQKNKVEDHSRSVKSSSNKKNCVIKPVCNDLGVLDFVNDVNLRSKSKSAKSNKKKTTWKPTSKIFTSVGYRWLPTGRTFTIDGTKPPLTRITSTRIVPPKETSQNASLFLIQQLRWSK
ncbi:hypothetical protein Tco_0531959 [Tanacetum coccineum]